MQAALASPGPIACASPSHLCALSRPLPQARALEAARGELGATRSRIDLIERELQANRRQLSSQGEQLERARYDLAAARYGLE